MDVAPPEIPRPDRAPAPSAPELTVILPAFEEAGAIRVGKLGKVVEWAHAQAPPAEVLVVDDGSRDATSELTRAHPVRLLHRAHGGKAAALAEGIREAKGRWVLLSDMDQATPIGEAPKLLAALEGGADIALGSRGWRRPGAPPGRVFLSLVHWLLRRSLVGLRWSDTQCGFKALRREPALEVMRGMRRYGAGGGRTPGGPCVSSGFDVEFLVVAERLGLRIAEVPVTWRYQETRRVSKVRDAWRGTVDLLAIAAYRLGGRYPGGRRGGAR